MTAPTPSFTDHLPPDVLAWIAAQATRRAVPAGAVLVSEDAQTGDIFFVSSGMFEVKVATAAGQQQSISKLGAGAVIGEMSWLDGGPASATIEALEPSEVLALSASTLDGKIASDHRFGSAFYRALAREAFTRLRAGNALLSKS